MEKIGSILIEELKAESERLAGRLATMSTNLHEVSIERDHLVVARDELREDVSCLEKKIIGQSESILQIEGTLKHKSTEITRMLLNEEEYFGSKLKILGSGCKSKH